MPYYNFRDDFKVARKTEKQVAQYFADVEGCAILEWCRTKDYDFTMQDKHGNIIAVEVKEDFTCQRTGNVGVEYSSRGKDSGIVTTRADKYVWKVHTPTGEICLYQMNVDKLREHINQGAWFKAIIGGDIGSESKNYLFRLEFLEKHAEFLTVLEN
jgi:hypothetical protein